MNLIRPVRRLFCR